MKVLYNKALELLAQVPAIKFTDLDKGQLEIGNTAVAFPCALVNINLPECTDVTDKIQRVRGQIVLRLGFDYTGQTSAATPEDARNKSLTFFDVIESVYAAFQGYYDEDIESISRAGVQDEQRADGLKVVQIAFDCWFDDETATI